MKNIIFTFLFVFIAFFNLYSADKTYTHSISVYTCSVIYEQHPPIHFSFGISYEILPFRSNTFSLGITGEYRGGPDSYGAVSLPLYMHISDYTKIWLAPSMYSGKNKIGETLDGGDSGQIKELFFLRLGISVGFSIEWLYVSPFISIGIPINQVGLLFGLNFEVRI